MAGVRPPPSHPIGPPRPQLGPPQIAPNMMRPGGPPSTGPPRPVNGGPGVSLLTGRPTGPPPDNGPIRPVPLTGGAANPLRPSPSLGPPASIGLGPPAIVGLGPRVPTGQVNQMANPVAPVGPPSNITRPSMGPPVSRPPAVGGPVVSNVHGTGVQNHPQSFVNGGPPLPNSFSAPGPPPLGPPGVTSPERHTNSANGPVATDVVSSSNSQPPTLAPPPPLNSHPQLGPPSQPPIINHTPNQIPPQASVNSNLSNGVAFPAPPISYSQGPATSLPPNASYAGSGVSRNNGGTFARRYPSAQPPVPQAPPQQYGIQQPPSQPNIPLQGAGAPPPQTGPLSSGPPSQMVPPQPTNTGFAPPTSGNLPNPGMPPQANYGSMPPRTNGMPPTQGQSRFGPDPSLLSTQLGGLSVTQTGFQKMWGQESVDLLQNRHILPPGEIVPPAPRLQAEQWNNINCSPDLFRSTLSKIPETDALLKKARLPLGVLIHPFKDLSHLPVIQCTTIVRCRSCRTYINPFVHFVDQRRWRCNLCYRVNELPEEFLYDPVSKSYGDPSRRPECKSSTIEFIAPQEYMLRPPQPAVYLFLLDVSRQALETGYLRNFCDTLGEELDKLPGDGRTQVGFITFHRTLQFYQITEGSSQATQLVVGDVDDVFLPSPTDLLANLTTCKEQITNMLNDLPELFNGSQETENCLGAALQAAYKLVYQTGGRITVFQSALPNVGPGALRSREMQGEKGSDTAMLNPSTDFYKKLALDCSGQQIAVDLFVLQNQHCDLATISGISKFSGGQVQVFPGYHTTQNPPVAERFDRALRRYLTRKIGFEAVMRIRCTRGMSLHTFHGHFFVRSTDLLSLPNVNPDTAFGMQVAIEEDLKDSREVSFQAALLYTSSKGERRIRVHTLCIPTTASLQEVVQGADQHCVAGLLAKMAADRTLNSSLADAREAFINVCVDTIERWKMVQCISQPGVLPCSTALKLIPLLTLALLKSPAFNHRPGLRLDDRTTALINMKCLPLSAMIQTIYPDLYRVDSLETVETKEDEDGNLIPQPPRLQLSAEKIAMNGAYLLDSGDKMILFIGKVTQPFFCEKIFGVSRPIDIDENLTDLPELENEDSERLRSFVQSLNNNKGYPVNVTVVRDDSKNRSSFINHLVDDRSEASFSYYEFLQHLKTQIK